MSGTRFGCRQRQIFASSNHCARGRAEPAIIDLVWPNAIKNKAVRLAAVDKLHARVGVGRQRGEIIGYELVEAVWQPAAIILKEPHRQIAFEQMEACEPILLQPIVLFGIDVGS